VTYNFAVPISTESLPADLVLTSMDTDTADVQLSGRESALSHITIRNIQAPLDLSGVIPGAQWVSLSRDTVRVPDPGIEVSRVAPRQVRVSVEHRMGRTVNIVADLSGEPAPGTHIVSIEVSPKRVTVSGAESAFYGLTLLRTQTIDLTGLDRSLRREVRLDLGGRDLEITETEPVYVTITVKKSSEKVQSPSPKALDKK